MLNIKKTLTKLLPTIGTNSIKFCGIGIAWGSFSSSGTWAYTQQYGITFSATPIVILSKAENASTASIITVVAKTTTQFSANFSTTANTKVVDWLAIGKV